MARCPLGRSPTARRHGASLLQRSRVRDPRRVYEQRDARDGEDHVRARESARDHAYDG